MKADSVQISLKEPATRHFQSADFLWGPFLLVTDAETSRYFAEVTVNQRRNWTEEEGRRRKIRSFPKRQQNSQRAVTETNEEYRGASVAEVLGCVKSQDAARSKILGGQNRRGS